MKTIAIFVHQPRCSVQSGNGIIKALTPHYRFKVFTKHELEDSFFDDVDMVCFPGGIGDSDSWDFLFKNNKSRIRRFVANGGRYLGICMGAYWADHHYFGISDIETHQYIRRPTTCTKRYYSKAVECNWNGNTDNFFFYDGPTFEGQGFRTIATYKNGDPMAVIKNNIGLIGCHLESEHFWYDKKYLKPHWHNRRHHSLLLDFVNNLMEN